MTIRQNIRNAWMTFPPEAIEKEIAVRRGQKEYEAAFYLAELLRELLIERIVCDSANLLKTNNTLIPLLHKLIEYENQDPPPDPNEEE